MSFLFAAGGGSLSCRLIKAISVFDAFYILYAAGKSFNKEHNNKNSNVWAMVLPSTYAKYPRNVYH